MRSGTITHHDRLYRATRTHAHQQTRWARQQTPDPHFLKILFHSRPRFLTEATANWLLQTGHPVCQDLAIRSEHPEVLNLAYQDPRLLPQVLRHRSKWSAW